MSGTLRKLKRGAIKNQCYQKNGNTKAFKDEWEKIHYGMRKDDDGNEVSVKTKKVKKQKQNHFDNGKAYVKYMKALKTFSESVRNKSQNKSSAREKVC